jgi:hypothetical protein
MEVTMSRETDKLMLKLPVADVAEWLRAELRETPNTSASMQSRRVTLLWLLAKLGADEDTKGEDDER